MNWLYYLMEANLYLLVFYAFYRLFLHDETFYSSNRYFLLTSTLIAFILPFIQLGLLKPAPILEVIDYQIEEVSQLNIVPGQVPESTLFDFTLVLYLIYFLVAAGFAFKLVLSIAKVLRLWIKGHKQRAGNITLVELQDSAAFSFFNLLFVHPHLADKKAVIVHEMVHIKQKHSFDILLFECLQVLCWFNPIIYFIKKDIKLLHEYIADELSTNDTIQKHEYAMFLIENSFGVSQTALTNQIFNQSILKRRINMLNKKRTAGRARLRLLLAIPLTLGMLCASTLAFTKNYGYIDLLPEKSNVVTAIAQDQVPNQNEEKQTSPKAKSTKKQTVAKAGKSKKKHFPSPPPLANPEPKEAPLPPLSPSPPKAESAPSAPRDHKAPPALRVIDAPPLRRPVENRNQNDNKTIRLNIDSAKSVNLKLRETKPLRLQLTKVRSNHIVALSKPAVREVVEVRLAQSPKLKEVIVTKPENALKEVVLLPTKTTTAKKVEVIELKVLPSVKATEIPVNKNN